MGQSNLFTAVSGRGQPFTWSVAYATPAGAPLTVNGWGLGQREAVHGTPLALVMTGQQSSLRREVSWRHLRLLQLQPRFAEPLDLCLLHRHEGRIPERGGDAAEVLRWVDTLAPLQEVTVHHVDCRASSRTCSWCGRNRPEESRVFRCRRCGHREESDLNAARVLRQRPLTSIQRAVCERPAGEFTGRGIRASGRRGGVRSRDWGAPWSRKL